MFRSTEPPGELEGQGRDIVAQGEMLTNHSGAFFGGQGAWGGVYA